MTDQVLALPDFEVAARSYSTLSQEFSRFGNLPTLHEGNLPTLHEGNPPMSHEGNPPTLQEGNPFLEELRALRE